MMGPGDDGPWLNSHIYHRVIMCCVWVMMGPRGWAMAQLAHISPCYYVSCVGDDGSRG